MGERPEFELLVQSFLANERAAGQTMESFLILPVQRVPRYKLLLEELRKHTPGDHPDRVALDVAITKVDDAAHRINECVRRRENNETIRRIQKRFVKFQDVPDLATLVQEGRVFVREGPLLKVCRREDKRFQFWLFSDIIMYGHAV